MENMENINVSPSKTTISGNTINATLATSAGGAILGAHSGGLIGSIVGALVGGAIGVIISIKSATKPQFAKFGWRLLPKFVLRKRIRDEIKRMEDDDELLKKEPIKEKVKVVL